MILIGLQVAKSLKKLHFYLEGNIKHCNSVLERGFHLVFWGYTGGYAKALAPCFFLHLLK